MSVLTTRTKVKNLLGIDFTDTTSDAIIDQIIPEAQSRIEKFLGYIPHRGTLTDLYLNGTGWRFMQIEGAGIRLPLYSITSLTHDQDGYYGTGAGSPFPSTGDLTEGTDYVVVYDGQDSSAAKINRNGILARIGSSFWYSGLGNYKLTYVGGWQDADLPQALVNAATELVAHIYDDETGTGALKRQRLGDYEVEYAASFGQLQKEENIPARIAGKLQTYRRIELTGSIPDTFEDPLPTFRIN